MDYFSTVPDEIILYIFTLLSRFEIVKNCSQVCKRWNKITSDANLWKEIDLRNKIVEFEIIERILLNGVKCLNLSKANFVKHNTLASILKYIPWRNENKKFIKLQSLHLCHALITIHTTEKLLSKCLNLKILKLCGLTLNKGIFKYISTNKNLEDLRLCSIKKFSLEGFLQVQKNCTNLKVLSLSKIELSTKKLNTVSSHISPSLETLIIKNNYLVCDKHIQQIVKQCPHLTKLYISGCYKVSAPIFNMVFRGFPKFKNVDLNADPISSEIMNLLKTADMCIKNMKKPIYNKILYLQNHIHILVENQIDRNKLLLELIRLLDDPLLQNELYRKRKVLDEVKNVLFLFNRTPTSHIDEQLLKCYRKAHYLIEYIVHENDNLLNCLNEISHILNQFITVTKVGKCDEKYNKGN